MDRSFSACEGAQPGAWEGVGANTCGCVAVQAAPDTCWASSRWPGPAPWPGCSLQGMPSLRVCPKATRLHRLVPLAWNGCPASHLAQHSALQHSAAHLVVQPVGQVVAQQQVEQRLGAHVVVAQHGGAVQRQQRAARAGAGRVRVWAGAHKCVLGVVGEMTVWGWEGRPGQLRGRGRDRVAAQLCIPRQTATRSRCEPAGAESRRAAPCTHLRMVARLPVRSWARER